MTAGQQTDIERLQRELAQLRSMCLAAGEEIERCWTAHCDSEGYGPVNLVSRLKGVTRPDWYAPLPRQGEDTGQYPGPAYNPDHRD